MTEQEMPSVYRNGMIVVLIALQEIQRQVPKG